MRVKITSDDVRIPRHPKANRGHVPKGTEVDVDKHLARRLVASKRAVLVDESDAATGPMDSEANEPQTRRRGRKPAVEQPELGSEG